jgi:membrane protein implicated in regulation of membrane protease activity
MGLDATARRRWFGALSILAALVMLIGGETVLKERLSAFSFLVYWLICFGFTSLAFLAAFLDVRALSRRTRQEQRELLDSTLRTIEKEAKTKSPNR